MNNTFRRLPPFLLLLAAMYCLASLAHFIHNAEYLVEYPNMPGWLSRSKVYATWLGINAIGAVGVLLARSTYSAPGFVLVAVYAALGFDGLGHYALAPMSSHTLPMNLTIWCEVLTATILLLFALRGLLLQVLRGRRRADT